MVTNVMRNKCNARWSYVWFVVYAVYLTCNRVIRFFPYTFDFRTCPFPSYDPFHIFADPFHGRKGGRGAWGIP